MTLGINFWYLLKAFQKGKKIKPSILPNAIIYFGSDDITFSNLEKLCRTKTKLLRFSDSEDIVALERFVKSNNSTEIIFDNNTVGFDRIIEK